jgi:hypothetical protein
MMTLWFLRATAPAQLVAVIKVGVLNHVLGQFRGLVGVNPNRFLGSRGGVSFHTHCISSTPVITAPIVVQVAREAFAAPMIGELLAVQALGANAVDFPRLAHFAASSAVASAGAGHSALPDFSANGRAPVDLGVAVLLGDSGEQLLQRVAAALRGSAVFDRDLSALAFALIFLDAAHENPKSFRLKMPITVSIHKGKPHKEGDPLVCCRCNASLAAPYDRMEDQHGNCWLYCEACTVAMFSTAKSEIEH